MANPNIAKLKKKASDFEQKKQFDRALSLYIQLLEEAGRDLDDADLQLYNRVGDLLQRQGNVSEALAYYEKAVDVYAERGFLNNAIALCNKVLRQSPARTSVYYKLGKISATKGFKSDAKKNFLEYAERMQKSGHTDEAFRALKEFADLCPDQDDIRLMLADWMQKENRKSEAVEQLETLYLKFEEEGREVEAKATVDRMKAIDPDAVPRPSGPVAAQKKKNDLIFLDLDAEEGPSARQDGPAESTVDAVSDTAFAGVGVVPALEGLVLTFHPDVEEQTETLSVDAPLLVDGFESTASDAAESALPTPTEVVGLEQASDETKERSVPTESLLTIEADSWSEPVEPVPHVSGLETPRVSLTGTHPVLSPLIDVPPMTGEEFGHLSLRKLDDAAAASGRSAHDLALPTDLPLLEPHDPRLDLLRVMGTPVGTPVIPDPSDDDAHGSIDLLSLPPVGDTLPASPSLEWPVTGSEAPVAIGASAPDENAPGENAPDEYAADVARLDADVPSAPVQDAAFPEAHAAIDTPEISSDAGDDHAPAYGDHQSAGYERAARDTAELVAQDGSARPTDELLAVPSEVIDEETRRSLREEFALDGDETPDSWVEAALSARDDFSLDRLLTPLGLPAIGPLAAEGSDAPAPHAGHDGDEEAPDSDGEREESLAESFARASTPSAEQAAQDIPPETYASEPDAEIEAVVAESDAETLIDAEEVSESLAVDGDATHWVDATPESEGASERAGTEALLEATAPALPDDEVDQPSADGASPAEVESPPVPEFDLLDELLPPFMRHDGAPAPSVAAGEIELDDAQLADIDAGADAHDAVPVGSALDVDALRALMLDRGIDTDPARATPTLDGEAIASAFSEGDVELPLLEVDDIVAPPNVDFIVPLDLEAASTADLLGEPPTFGESGPLEFEPAPLFEHTPDAEDEEPDVPESLTDKDTDDEWADDEAPEVLIDGEWHDERMGGLVSGEVSAIRPPGGDVPPRPKARWDDLSAALLWPGNEGVPDGEPAASAASNDAEQVDAGEGDALAPSATPRRTLSFGGVEAQLRRRLELEPENLTLRRQLGETLLDQGSRVEGLEELDVAMRGFEVAGDLENARRVADVVLRVIPTSVRHHQKRVEYAVRSNDRVRLVEAYVELADSLFRSGEPEKARVVYSRVLELSPGNGRARFALGLLSDEEMAERGATPPATPVAPLPAPSPADMVSMFDRSIPRTPERDVTSISAELPIIADSLFSPPAPLPEAAADALLASDEPAADIQEVVEFEREQTSAAEQQATAEATALADAPATPVDEFDRAVAAVSDTERASDDGVAADGLAGEELSLGGATEATMVDVGVNEPVALDSSDAAVAGEAPDDQHVSTEGIALGDPEAEEPRAETASAEASDLVGEGENQAAEQPESIEFAQESSAEPTIDAAGDDDVAPFPAPSLDDQIDEAFAAPPIVELAGEARDGAGSGFGPHDGSATPPLGAAAYATPFSSGLIPPPADMAALAGATPRSATPVALPIAELPLVAARDVERAPAAQADRGARGGDDDFVDLGSWLRDDEPVRSTRMVTSDPAPTGDEQADFDEMLRRFKQGVAANVDEEDFASHYDLGVAYKEMGLVDEAIAEFQKSLRGDTHRVRSYEALGQCFVEKGQHQVALTLLHRAVESTRADDQQLVGVLYLLGYASEVLSRHADALRYYQRVFAVDIEFRDVAQRVAAIEQLTQ